MEPPESLKNTSLLNMNVNYLYRDIGAEGLSNLISNITGLYSHTILQMITMDYIEVINIQK